MLTAIDFEGVKRTPYIEDVNFLRTLSNEGNLHCPDCQTSVILVAGRRRVHHFRHQANVECTYDSEPETEEHARGKINIYKWLKKRYPEAKVEFEYRIIETNQRADVIVIFPDGEKWAFEMQCSPISGDKWVKRSKLYKQAGVKDFWFIGESLRSYGKTDGEEDMRKHRLKDLPLTIFNKNNWLLFFDSESHKITGFYKFEDDLSYDSTILYARGNQFLLHELKRIEEFWGNDQVEKKYMIWLEEEKQLIEEKKKEEERQREIRRKNKMLEEKKIEKARKFQQELKSFRCYEVAKKMTKNEKTLFEKLLRKHNLNDHNFPGICKIYVEHTNLIATPYPLWQLYIYDKYIYPSTDGEKKVWVPKVVDDIKRRFRVIWDKENDAHYSFAIYRYFAALAETKRVIQLSRKNGKYYQVISNELPDFNNFKIQSFIAYYLSIHFVVDTGKDEQFKEEILKAWNRYMNNYISRPAPYYNPKNYNNLQSYTTVSKSSVFDDHDSSFHSLFDQYDQLEDMLKLASENISCLTEIEREFLANFSSHLDYDRRITLDQWENYLVVKKKIEDFL